MSNIIATVSTCSRPVTVSAVGIQGISGTSRPIEEAPNVDATNLQNGSLLIYNTTSSMWVASKLLNAQDMDAGEF